MADSAVTTEAGGQDGPFVVSDDLIPDPSDSRANIYAPGMRKTGQAGIVRVALLSADPPPPFRGDSTWTLYVTDIDGIGIPDATLSIVPRVPDHGHGTPVKAVITPGEIPGVYQATPVNLFVQALWVTTINVVLPDGRTDAVQFGFLIGE